jgi:hypothetical protein
MLLILAPSEDEAAMRFERMVQSRGIGVTRATMDAVSVYVGLDRSGTASVELSVLGVPVHGVLNRGLAIDPATQFEDSERLAAWWSGLAYFPGPVVNRPSRLSFLPELDVLLLAERVPNLSLSPMHIGSIAPPSFVGRTTNVHSAHDGHFIGRDTTPAKKELFLYTSFDPERTSRFVLAGDKCFATDIAPSSHTSASGVIESLRHELRAQSATFSFVVFQVSSSSVELIHATPVPGIQHYEKIEEDVHEALLEYLLR